MSSNTALPILHWTTVCSVSQLEPLWGEAALLGGQQIALFLLPDGTVYAVSNEDPATGSFVMSRGIVGSKGERHTIASPLHKQVYDLATGECLSTQGFSLRTYPAEVRDGSVCVGMPPTPRDDGVSATSPLLIGSVSTT